MNGSKLGSFFYLAVVFALVLACGKQTPPPRGGDEPVTPPGPSDPQAYTLVLFGAPWCTNCKSDFPKINEGLKAELASGKVKGLMYVTTGKTSLSKPTDEIAVGYKDSL